MYVYLCVLTHLHSSTHTGWVHCPPHRRSLWTWECSWATAWRKHGSGYYKWGKHV